MGPFCNENGEFIMKEGTCLDLFLTAAAMIIVRQWKCHDWIIPYNVSINHLQEMVRLTNKVLAAQSSEKTTCGELLKFFGILIPLQSLSSRVGGACGQQ